MRGIRSILAVEVWCLGKCWWLGVGFRNRVFVGIVILEVVGSLC